MGWGGQTCLSHRVGWPGAGPHWNPGLLTSRLGLSPFLWCPRASGGRDSPHWEGCWHTTLSRSRWAFWINSPAVVLRSGDTKGPRAGRGGGGSVGSRAPGAHCDNHSFQNTEARISRGWGQRGILGSGARERSQTIPGGRATGYSGTAGPRFQIPHSPRPLSEPQFPTCKPTL